MIDSIIIFLGCLTAYIFGYVYGYRIGYERAILNMKKARIRDVN